MKNIRPLRDDPNAVNKIGCALSYLVFAWVVARTDVGNLGGMLSTFLVIGMLVWVFIIRQRNVKYFVRYHVVQSLLLNISLCAVLWLLSVLISFLNTIPLISMLAGLLSMILFSSVPIGGFFSATPVEILVMSFGIVMAFYAAIGQYAELPWITDGARHWL